MCKRSMCTELGDDPTQWSRRAPLIPPPWFHEQLELFSASAHLVAAGNIALAISTFNSIRSDDLRHWFEEHGARSGTWRRRKLGLKRPPPPNGVVRDRYPGVLLQRQLLARDNQRCRYCGVGLIAKKILLDFGATIGTNAFRASTDAERHGVLAAFRANFDHVVPAAWGGLSDPDNLVACCWSCNYGKRSRTLEEMGLDHPLLHQPYPPAGWDGLDSIAQPLAQAARAARRGEQTGPH